MLRLASATALLWLATGPAARAQIAPDALWSAWQDGTGSVTATGTATPDGAALAVEAPRIRIGALQLTAGSLRLVPDGDATLIDLPDSFAMGQGTIAADIMAADLTLRATGDPADPTYTLVAPQMDAVLGGETLTADLSVTGIDATIAPDSATARAARLAISSDGAGFAASRTDVELTVDGPLDALTTLAAGQAGDDVSITLDAAETTQDTELTEGRGTLRIATGPSQEVARVTGGTVTLGQTASDTDLALDTPALPIAAATLNIAQTTSSLTGPVEIGADPAPTAFTLSLDGIAASEELWQLFDPTASLSRDPARLRLSTSGEAVRTSASEYTAGRMALDSLSLSVLGAELTGQGAVTFTRPEAPLGRPVGTFAFTLTGALDLLDRLQALQTLPGGPLVGARMGLGFFTRPGAADEELVSTVKIGPDGIVTVNEQQVYAIPRSRTRAPAQ